MEPPRTVPTGTSLHEVARLLAVDGVRAIVVVDGEGTPVGIVTERDLVVRALAWNRAPETPVDAVMTSELVTVEPSAPTRSVYRLLQEHGIRQVPLVDSGRLVGIITRDDLADEAAAEVLAVLGACPRCGQGLRPVSTADATNFLCLWCRSCWHLAGGTFVTVETRSCPGCPEHNFCRFPLIDYGVDPIKIPATPPVSLTVSPSESPVSAPQPLGSSAEVTVSATPPDGHRGRAGSVAGLR